MKNITNYIHMYPKRARGILGISYDQFISLMEQAKLTHQEQKAQGEKNKRRVNAAGGGRKPKLKIEEEICLTLFYLRQMPTFEVLGLQFGISKTEANDTFHYWLGILRKILPSSMLEQLENQEVDYAMAQELLQDFELIVDSFEQAIERPEDNEEQKRYYSGKKKYHSFKNQVVTMPKGGDIVDVTVGTPGPTSDISLFRGQQEKFNSGQKFQGDKAYTGGDNMTTPQKKPRNKELTDEQKEANKKLSSKRIFVEHIIRIIKIFRIASERFRLHKDTYEKVILTICGLVRLRIDALILPNL